MLKSQLEKQIRNLATISHTRYQELPHIGVLGGQSGIALFQFYCAKYFEEDTFADAGVEIITDCMDKINEGYSFPSYCNGVAGFGWALQHLADEDFIDLNLDDLFLPFDEYLFSRMVFEFKNEYYDLLHGALGYGFYFLKRYSSPKTSAKNKIIYEGYLESLIDQMDKLAIKEGKGLKWESILNIEKENKGYNLSLSHGMSSIIYLLSKIKIAGISPTKTEYLLLGAQRFVIALQSKKKKDLSLFPSWVDPLEKINYTSRLAWCYGDIGIGLSMQLASKALNDPSLADKAIEILDHTTKRTTPEESLVIDAGFCHGSFGNSYIFAQIAKNEDISGQNFSKAAEFWMKDGLARHTGTKEEPYLQFDGIQKKYVFHLNLLEGIAGIGLSMIDYLSGKENTWDECLMLR